MPTPTLSAGGIQFMVHQQTTPASTWTITHNFGKKPVVEVRAFDGPTMLKAYPLMVDHTNDDTVTITWSQAYAGEVTLAAETEDVPT
jgi:hypothetical protein